jgi:hypothetical protein
MMKDVVWTSLVTSLQWGNCVLVLGPEIVAAPTQQRISSEMLYIE